MNILQITTIVTQAFSFGLAIKCYTGTKIINSPFSPNLSYVAEECAPDVNACVTAEFTTKQTFGVFSITVQIISGGCYIAHPAHPVLCASYCNTLKSAFSYISNCKGTCCYRDECNKDRFISGTSQATTAKLPVSVTGPNHVTTMTPPISVTGTSQVTNTAPPVPVTANRNGITCFTGVKTIGSSTNVTKKEKCYSCLTVEVTKIEKGQTESAVIGDCRDVIQGCDDMCPVLKEQYPTKVFTCKSSCCHTNECNKNKLSSELTGNGITCFTGGKFVGSTTNVMKKDKCYACLTLEATTIENGKTKYGVFGGCRNATEGCNDSCPELRQRFPTEMSSCKSSCCYTNECNKNKLSSEVTGNGITCFTGGKFVGSTTNVMKKDKCYACLTLEATAIENGKTKYGVFGGCRNATEGCNDLCPELRQRFPTEVSSCKSHCCYTDECNKDKFNGSPRTHFPSVFTAVLITFMIMVLIQ